MLSQTRNALAAALIGAVSLAAPAAQADNLIISTGLGHTHLWVGDHMNPFADAIEQATNGEISFTRFYAASCPPSAASWTACRAERSRSPRRCSRPTTRASSRCRT